MGKFRTIVNAFHFNFYDVPDFLLNPSVIVFHLIFTKLANVRYIFILQLFLSQDFMVIDNFVVKELMLDLLCRIISHHAHKLARGQSGYGGRWHSSIQLSGFDHRVSTNVKAKENKAFAIMWAVHY